MKSVIFETPHNDTVGKTLYLINGPLVFLFFSLTFLFWGGTGVSPAIMLLLSPLAFLVNKPLELQKEHKQFFIALILMFAMISISEYRSNPVFKISKLDQPMRYILFIPVMLYLLKTGFNKYWFWLGIYAAGLICGYESITFQKGIWGARVGGPFNPIIWGDIALIVCIASTIRLINVIKTRDLNFKFYRWQIEATVAVTSTLGCLAGVFLSGSRGAWLTLLLLLAIANMLILKKMPLKKSIITISLVLLLPLAAYKLPFFQIAPRVNSVISDLEAFELGKGRATSTGLRIEMWYTSVQAFAQSPLIGLGKIGLTSLEYNLVEQGKVHEWVVKKSSQQHSDFFDALAKSGLTGILILGYFYMTSLRLSRTLSNIPLSNMLVISVIAFIGFGLTNTILIGMNGTMFLLGLISFITTSRINTN